MEIIQYTLEQTP